MSGVAKVENDLTIPTPKGKSKVVHGRPGARPEPQQGGPRHPEAPPIQRSRRRTRRDQNIDGESQTNTEEPEPQAQLSPDEVQRREFATIVERANAGDKNALQKLRSLLDENPAIWRTVGDLSRHAELFWIDLLAGKNTLAHEAIKRTLAEFKSGLSVEGSSGIERALADLIGVRWLAVQYGEQQAANVTGDLRLINSRLRRAESAEKRFASSVKLLLMLRANIASAACAAACGKESR
ncbi:MAG: hypothetical protein WCL32_22730 [Planctomycetota bacterium]